jgi:hypothetical protein
MANNKYLGHLARPRRPRPALLCVPCGEPPAAAAAVTPNSQLLTPAATAAVSRLAQRPPSILCGPLRPEFIPMSIGTVNTPRPQPPLLPSPTTINHANQRKK